MPNTFTVSDPSFDTDTLFDVDIEPVTTSSWTVAGEVVPVNYKTYLKAKRPKQKEVPMFTCNACKNKYPVKKHYTSGPAGDTGLKKQLAYGHIIDDQFNGLLCIECFKMLVSSWEPKEVNHCKHCSTLYAVSEDIPVPGVCHSCFSIRYKRCEYCELWDFNTATIVVDKDETLHTICIRCQKGVNGIKKCYGCGRKHISDNSLCPYCQDRLFRCEICKGLTNNIDKRKISVELYSTPVDITCCSGCAERTFVCNGCRKVMPHKEKYTSSSGFCQTCATVKKGAGEKRAHNYSPAYYNRVGKSNNNLYFGIENEITVVTWEDYNTNFAARTKVKKDLVDIVSQYGFDKLFIKHDGTIGGEPAHGATGFEVVLQPHTFKSLKTTDWSGIFPQGVKRHYTCGMHIHMNKEAFTTFHLYKFLEFVYNNREFITFIGERDYTDYCSPNPPTRIKKDAKKKLFHSKGPGEQYRRQAINLCNPDTVELRFFCNAEDENVMMKNVEFCHALYMFTKTVSAKESASVLLFKEFITKFPKKYPNLIYFVGGSI